MENTFSNEFNTYVLQTDQPQTNQFHAFTDPENSNADRVSREMLNERTKAGSAGNSEIEKLRI